MPSLPPMFVRVIAVFAPVFSKPVCRRVKVFITRAILASGRGIATASLRVRGFSTGHHFQSYHRVLNRAVWWPLTAGRLLLRRLVAIFVPWGTVVLGLDDTTERRRGDHLRAKGISRDPVRSSHSHFGKVSGLLWLCCMLLSPIQ
jgi:DDE superfamily endonuclease